MGVGHIPPVPPPRSATGYVLISIPRYSQISLIWVVWDPEVSIKQKYVSVTKMYCSMKDFH